MRRSDWVVLLVVSVVVAIFAFCPSVRELYAAFNAQHGMVMTFFKFAVLATFGESLGLRVRRGVYDAPGFGLLPRAVVWGLLGLTIKFAFVVFGQGVPAFLEYMGFANAGVYLAGPMGWQRVVVALSVSVAMNVIYAPVMMVVHKITDTHILQHGGRLSALLRPIAFGRILRDKIDWGVQWSFVFVRTIPLFWIPAHTISFLLPGDFQTLFAALLGIALGLILAVASSKRSSEDA